VAALEAELGSATMKLLTIIVLFVASSLDVKVEPRQLPQQHRLQ
jgi:hypothetical protein